MMDRQNVLVWPWVGEVDGGMPAGWQKILDEVLRKDLKSKGLGRHTTCTHTIG